jgi:hypothetical protein
MEPVDFRLKAAECLEASEVATSERLRLFWQRSAEHYERLAILSEQLRDHEFEPIERIIGRTAA